MTRTLVGPRLMKRGTCLITQATVDYSTVDALLDGAGYILSTDRTDAAELKDRMTIAERLIDMARWQNTSLSSYEG